MKRIFWNKIFLMQYILTSAVLLMCYMFFALLESEWDFVALIGYVLFQPLIGIFISILTILLCAIVGLPIRLNSKLNIWWTKNYIISALGILIGLTLFFLSYKHQFVTTQKIEIDGFMQDRILPNWTLLISGWFLTGFMTLHLFIFKQKVESKNAV